MMLRWSVLLLSLCLLFAADEPRWLVLNRASREALAAKDYAGLRETLLELKPLLPGNPRVVYNLAVANARLGDAGGALAGLQDLANMGLIYDLSSSVDFLPLRSSPGFAAIVSRMEENKAPVSHSRPAFSLEERDLLPEDIACDPATRRFFVASVRASKIITVDGHDFAKTDWPVLALRVDSGHGLLWVASGWLAHCARCDKADEGKTALISFDLHSGAQRQKIEAPVKGLLGDMTIGRAGDIFVSESIHGAVFRLRSGSGRMERLDTPGEFASPQTPALSPDEKTLYVADYMRGIAALDLATGRLSWLKPVDGIALAGIDGLYLYRDSFLAVQNGTAPPRIIRFSLDLRQQQVLEANTPELGEPTHGTLVGNTFYYIANSGWPEYDDEGKKKPGSPPVQSSIRQIVLRNRVEPRR